MGYLFDLDGTLLDHEHATLGGLSALRAARPILSPESEEEIHRRWQIAEAKHFRRFELRELSLEEHRRERLRDTFPEYCRRCAESELDELYEMYLRGYERAWRLYPDAAHVLQELKSAPVAIVTNGPGPLQRAKLNRLGLEKRFQVVAISTEVGFAKPDRRIFEYALQSLRMPPHLCTFVGDNFHNDVAGAAAAGLKAVWINRTGAVASDHSVGHRDIRSLTELL